MVLLVFFVESDHNQAGCTSAPTVGSAGRGDFVAVGQGVGTVAGGFVVTRVEGVVATAVGCSVARRRDMEFFRPDKPVSVRELTS